MDLAFTRPLLSAMSLPGALLVLGDKDLGIWFETRPAVVLPEQERPAWVGSRQIVQLAGRRGLLRLRSVGRRLTTYELTAEGRSLARDMEHRVQVLTERVRDLEEEVRLLSDEAAPEDDLLPEDVALSASHNALLATMARCAPQPATREALVAALQAINPNFRPTFATVRAYVRDLRERGWVIETMPKLGYTLIAAGRIGEIEMEGRRSAERHGRRAIA